MMTDSIECAHCGQATPMKEALQCGDDCGTAYCADQCATDHWIDGQHYEFCGKAAGHKGNAGGGKWMSHLHLHKGALTRKAKAKHMSVHDYEEHPPKHISGKTKKQIALAKTFAKSNHKK